MRRKWLASDLHLGHANIAGPNTSQWRTGFRNFSSVEEMDHTIIDTLNRYVMPDDELFLIGDFAFGGHTKIPDYRRRIACQNIHIVRGNHDDHINKYADYFSSIQDLREETIVVPNVGKIPVIMCHYAFRVWKGSHKGWPHAYGHSHGSLEHTPYGRSEDVGIDVNYRKYGEYCPLDAVEWVEQMLKRDIVFPDHHNSKTNVR